MIAPRRSTNQRAAYVLLLVLSFALWAYSRTSPEPQHWRFWKDPNASPPILGAGWIGVNPDGKVFISQAKNSSIFFITEYDGYTFGSLPAGNAVQYVFQGFSKDIWAIRYAPEEQFRTIGIDRYACDRNLSEGQWIHYDLEDIPFLDSINLPIARGINLIPIPNDHLVILLQDRLIRTDASFTQPTILKNTAETNLGQFIHLSKSRDGGVWITGERGLAKATGFEGHTLEWDEFIVPEELGVRDFAIPIEGNHGELFSTASANHNGRRVLVHFDDSAWDIISASDEYDVAMGWRGVDNTVWLLKAKSVIDPLVPCGILGLITINWFTPSLWWLQDGQEQSVERGGDISGYYLHIAPESTGAFWLGQTRGVARYAPATWRKPLGCPKIDNQVITIHEDSFGRLWFATSNALLSLSGDEWRVFALPEKMMISRASNFSVCSIAKNRVAFITDDKRLFLLDPTHNDGIFQPVQHPKGCKIYAVLPYEDRLIRVVTEDNESRTQNIETFDGNQFRTILGEQENLRLGIKFHDFLETESDLWLTGSSSICKYRNGNYHNYEFVDEERSGPYFCLAKVEDGKIWFGGENKIIEFDGISWRVVKAGLGGVHQIVRRRDGSVWVASRTGIHRFYENSWISNTDEDGLPTDYLYRLFEDSQGRFWAGTSTGIALYHPEADPDPPETYISSDENLAETPPGGDVRFVCSGMDRWNYTEAKRLMFSHRFDKGPWSPFVSNTVISATGFSSGKHQLEVRAIDRNLNVDLTPASYEFTVLLPWYREPVFLVLLFSGSSVILILVGIHLYYLFNLEKTVNTRTAELQRVHHELLNHQQRLRSMASAMSVVEERDRRQIAEYMHDRIGHSLALCRMQIATAQKKTIESETVDSLAKTEALVAQIIEDTRSMTFEISPPILYSIGLEAALEWLAEQFQKQYNLNVIYHDDGCPKPLEADARGLLFRAVRELLFNVVKHARATQAKVSVSYYDGHIQIDVEDDGVGFDPNQWSVAVAEEQTFGLFSIRERIEYLGGSFVHHAPAGNGTRITLILPLAVPSQETAEGGPTR